MPPEEAVEPGFYPGHPSPEPALGASRAHRPASSECPTQGGTSCCFKENRTCTTLFQAHPLAISLYEFNFEVGGGSLGIHPWKHS